jgi:hypothetical protein
VGHAVADRDLNFLRAAVGREVLREAAGALRASGIPLAPLKGVYLQACVYERPEERPITDVDVLVPESRFDDARACLRSRGWGWRPVHTSEAGAWHPAFGLPLDVHRRLFLPGVFNLPTDAVLARARSDASTFGFEVSLPDPADVFAHLVGHFVKSRAGIRDTVPMDDFERLGSRMGLDAERCARHLERVGMARAARYALGCARVGNPDGFAARVLGRLRRDRVGDALARVAHVSAARQAEGRAGAWAGFALDRSLAHGGLALARHMLSAGNVVKKLDGVNCDD